MKSNSKAPIYLDYNASTPLDPQVVAAMTPYLTEGFGNPSSNHYYGRRAKEAIENARVSVANLIGASPSEIVFTSGGSESNNMALRGLLESKPGAHLITSVFEHPAIEEVSVYLENQGIAVTRVPVSSEGFVDIESIQQAIRPETKLISIMHANNEIGSIQDINAISSIAREYGIPVHTDAAQSVGKIPVSVTELGVSLLTIAGHKLYGPKGVGALYVKNGVQVDNLMFGAGHEGGVRPGTENVLEIVGLGAAATLARDTLATESIRQIKLRDSLWNSLESSLNIGSERIVKNTPLQALPNTLSVSIKDIQAQDLMAGLPELALSAGAACHSGDEIVSNTLKAIGLPLEYAGGTLRMSIGRQTTGADIEKAARLLIDAIQQQGYDGSTKTTSNDSEVKLTQFTAGLGCGCKLGPEELENVLRCLSRKGNQDSRILHGFENREDATVFDNGDRLLSVQSVDFFTPVLDKPYDFGAVAAANALSDVYAMGATPTFALSVLAYPTRRLSGEVLQQILQGATDKCAEAGIQIAGGHSVDDTSLKFGLVANGVVKKEKLWTNSGANAGDVLILTKPIGTGVLATALKAGELSDSDIVSLTEHMSQLNKTAAETLRNFAVTACTDVTGFGLIGHLGEMMKACNCSVTLESEAVPLLEKAEAFTARGILPGGALRNFEYTSFFTEYAAGVDKNLRLLLNDAQTSGGLLCAVDPASSQGALLALKSAGINAFRIGVFTNSQVNSVSVL